MHDRDEFCISLLRSRVYTLTRVPALRNLVDARLLEVIARHIQHQDGSE
jgi:hypothetical protein